MKESTKQHYRRQAKQSLARARKQLDIGELEAVRYAALELRTCIESVIYMDLNAYPQGSLPPEAYSKWQPTRVVQYILDRDPNYHYDGAIYIAKCGELFDEKGRVRRENAVKLGQHNFSKNITKRKYHMLGTLLHTQTTKQIESKLDVCEKIPDLLKIADDLERRLSATLQYMVINHNLDHICMACKTPNVFSFDIAGDVERQTFYCTGSKCPAQYVVVKDDKGEYFIFPLAAHFHCRACKKHCTLWQEHAQIGTSINCVHCGKLHVVNYCVDLIDGKEKGGKHEDPKCPPKP